MAKSRSRFSPYARAAGRVAGRMALSYGKSYIKSKFNRKKQSETGVTSQYDRVVQYSKKSMPRRKKSQWKRFVRKVQAVELKSLGTKTQVYNSKMTVTSTGPFQAVGSACLYGYEGNQDTAQTIGNRDIFRVCNNDQDTMISTTDGNNGARIMFKSGIIDLTMRNTGGTSIEVDVYEINVRTDSTKKGNFIASVVEAENDTGTIPNATGNTGLSLGNRGVTLFDMPNLISQDNLSIYKKRKYFLPSGSTATLQHRDPRNHYFNVTDISITETGVGSYAKRNFTQMYVFVAKSVVESGEDTGTSLTVGCTRKYSYVINTNARCQDTYNPNGI